jgi:hypothetical protein
MLDFLGDLAFDNPNQWGSSLDFENRITAMALSFHGFILAVGFADGQITLCDSETATNRRIITGHQSPISSLSFSRHGHFLASADVSGMVQVKHILADTLAFTRVFRTGIFEISFSSLAITRLLVLETSHQLSIADAQAGEIHEIPGEFFAACWSPCSQCIVAAGHKEIYIIDPESLQIMSQTDIGKTIHHISISHNGLLLIILLKLGNACLFNIEAGITVQELQNSAGGRKWTCACFSHDDQHMIFSSNVVASCTLMIFDLQGLMKSDLQGPSEAVGDVMSHPIWPHIYTRGITSLRIWTPTYLNSWAKFVPGFDDVLANDMYHEKETEFDEEEDAEEICRSPDVHIDINTGTRQALFPSDVDFPDQLIYLPLDVQKAVENSTAQPASTS